MPEHVKANSIWIFHNHLKNIYEKLGVQNCTEAVIESLQKLAICMRAHKIGFTAHEVQYVTFSRQMLPARF